MEKAGLDYRVVCETLPHPVSVDHDMWEKIVLNLVSNAFKYTLEGSVSVSLRHADENAVLEVSDTGVGIPSLELDRMFERFHRIEDQDGRTDGMNGRQLADAARALRPKKVLFITRYAENAAVRAGLVEPGMAVLTKPFSVEQLAVKVVEIMGD